jgi:sarcosine oxidase gamma subunit
MPDRLVKQPAIEDVTGLPPESGFTLGENPDRGLWSVLPAKDGDPGAFAEALTGKRPGDERLLQRDDWRLLRLSPREALLLGGGESLPASLDAFAPWLTDIGHAYCELELSGAAVIDAVAAYTSVDPRRGGRARDGLRCRLGHYAPALWWDNDDTLRFIIERSLAQSFADHLCALLRRWRLAPSW